MAKTDLHVTMMTRRGAEEFDRRTHSVPSTHSLGWTPYRIHVRSHGGSMAYTAFVTATEFKRWLWGHGYVLKLGGHWGSKGLRVGWIHTLEDK